MNIPTSINTIIRQQPYSLLFTIISGSHLYGFPSPDSDYDLRGVHILPIQEIVGLKTRNETIEVSEIRESLEIDLVTHDVKKFFLMLLKKNGYVLEQLYSPLILTTSPEHNELKIIAKNCITRHHSYHYFGFAATQWKLFEKEHTYRIKPLLYVYRVLLTGIYLMQTGRIEANLIDLNEVFNLSYISDLIAQKLAGTEKSALSDINVDFHKREYERLRNKLQEAYQSSLLPETPSANAALDDLLIRLRTRSNKL
ncbi:nucleotidyltransferase domain-containing protein [Nostoc sp. 'Lobaria pulmonaria (5183) cyanobiont']|uniref:nucleotidyltransferase domain-containing protein n=1 Tax=Nostoc sp. 'Lobaria pulmonaria (5183) cyanobiont' TaxID=1618022 RepID=UPI000CF351E3|nr:nucleotidyltransferase domain-containing protein [Nostoc sp. 'Lobaria pulmonaria (5183) cyanobiont']AVH70940.1 nucleotidyltransferase [Nostoc sp. 'Lobaria pulmonaria (5183) cyanobiont']